MNRYFAFGLHICSDVPLLNLPPSKSEYPCLTIKALPQPWSDPGQDKPGLVCTESGDSFFFFSIPHLAAFWVSSNQIGYYADQPLDARLLNVYLLGSALGAALWQRNTLLLHGNAISWDQKNAVIFVGQQGAGKSTQSAYHYLQGASILSDDICAIQFDAGNMPYVIPGFPQIKIWQTTADLLGIDTAPLDPIAERETKFMLPIQTEHFCTKPLPIQNVFEIRPENRLNAEEIQGADKLDLLLRHRYRPRFARLLQKEAFSLKQCIALARHVATYQAKRADIPVPTSSSNVQTKPTEKIV